MAVPDALALDESLRCGDVSRAWLIWSGAAESALVDAYQFAGRPVPDKGFVLGRRSSKFLRFGWEGPRYAKLVVVLLILVRLVTFSKTVILQLPLCLT